MHERALQRLLLIQAIEETDPEGAALPMADRVEASRAVVGNGPVPVESELQTPLSSAVEWFPTRRAELLFAKLRARSPGLEHVLVSASTAPSLDRGLLVLAVVAGLVLAFLDGKHRINIFAFPLLGLIVWNLCVYAIRISRNFKPEPATRRGWGFWFGHWYTRRVRAHLDTLLTHSGRFNAPLAPGLRRFAGDWWELAQPLLMLRARRLLHLSAAALAFGLIVGFYVQSVLLRYAAGWDGSPLGLSSAHAILMALYGPASAFTGITIPSSDALAALRWTDSPAGSTADAIPWANLIAWTAVFYIVVPRLIAAVITSVAQWRLSRHLTAPPTLSTYARTLLASARPIST